MARRIVGYHGPLRKGEKHAHLLLISDAFRRPGRTGYHFRALCDCGREHVALAYDISQGKTRSCGCTSSLESGISRRTHFMCDSPEYRAWCNMRNRCGDPTNRQWKDYGGRGIKVCERWLESFENFIADLGRKPGPRHSLGRIDNDGDYEPGNVRWETRRQQSLNSRGNTLMTLRGETMTMTEWCEKLGLRRNMVSLRHQRGWSDEEALTTPRLRHWRDRKIIR